MSGNAESEKRKAESDESETEQTVPSLQPLDSEFRVTRIDLLILVAFSAVASAAILNVKPLLSANDRSRWCTVRALVEQGTYVIDDVIWERGWNTIDKVRYRDHFYSTKPPLLPTLIAGLTWGIQQTTGLTLSSNTADVTHVVLFFVNLLSMLAALIVLLLLFDRYAQPGWCRIYLLFAAAFGTLLLPFLVTLNNHTVAATSVIFAVYPAMRIVIDGEQRPRYYLLAGFFAAFACCNELPAALFGLAMFGLLFHKASRLTLIWFVPAALVPLAGFFWTNYLVTSGIRPFYLYNGQNPGPYFWEFDGVRSYWYNPKGLDKSVDSTFTYLLHCTVGHHGLFSLSPIFLITLMAWVKLKSWKESPLRPFLWLGLGLTVAVMGFYLTRTGNYNYGGNTAGLRWMFWLIPFWLVSMIPVFENWGNRRWFQILAGCCLAISVFSAVYPLNNPWKPPWLFTLMEYWNWIDYSG